MMDVPSLRRAAEQAVAADRPARRIPIRHTLASHLTARGTCQYASGQLRSNIARVTYRPRNRAQDRSGNLAGRRGELFLRNVPLDFGPFLEGGLVSRQGSLR